MGFLRPATPGFIVTCVATVLLAVVSFCVPFFKSVYFLKASISVAGTNRSITFGTLGYCVELPSGANCSKPTVGYELDINALVGNKSSIAIPPVVVKWLTYCLVLHVVALGLSAGSAVFGLLAHIREVSMTCFSTCISGFAAVVALLAFIFDIAIFFAAKARINAVGSATLGNATWLTLAAWLLLFFSGCFFTLGRCCISKRGPRSSKWDKVPSPVTNHTPADQMHLDAVKAEADRKARQKNEVGLPAFHEVLPLTGHIDGDKVYVDEPQHNAAVGGPSSTPGGGYTGGGYVQAPPGSRAVDEYYSPTRTDAPASTYPPAPQASHSHSSSGYAQHTAPVPHRQPSGYAQSQHSKSNYTPSTYNYNYNAPQTSSPPPTNQYFPTATAQPYSDPYSNSGREYGHYAGGSSYHTAISHDRQATNYSNYDSYDAPQQPAYNNYSAPPAQAPSPANYYQSQSPLQDGVPAPAPSASYMHGSSNYYQAPAPPQSSHQGERGYTLDGRAYTTDGYGANILPPLHEQDTSYLQNPNPVSSSISSPPAPINTNTGYTAPTQTSPVKGPRAINQLTVRNEDADAPPLYEPGPSNVQGAWGKNR